MAWTYEQNFNALTTGDLNAQDSWSGDTDFDVVTNISFEGAKAVHATNGNGYIARAVTGVSAGVFYIMMMRPDTAGDAEFNLRTSTNGADWGKVVMESSNIELWYSDGAGSATSSNLVTGYVVNQWYIFRVTINSTSSFKVEVSTGGAFSDPLGNKTSITTGSVDTLRLGCGGVGQAYWDTITVTNPIGQIFLDAVTNLGSTAGTALTSAHICSGTNRGLFVQVRTAGTTDTLSTITYAGVNMVLVNKTIGINNLGTYLYYLAAPTTGSNNVVITTGVAAISAVAASYNGVKQSGNPDSSNTNSNASTTGLTTSTTQVADNCWSIMAVNSGSGNDLAGIGTVLAQAGPNTGVTLFHSQRYLTPAGSISAAFTCDLGAAACVLATFSPATFSSATSMLAVF